MLWMVFVDMKSLVFFPVWEESFHIRDKEVNIPVPDKEVMWFSRLDIKIFFQ